MSGCRQCWGCYFKTLQKNKYQQVLRIFFLAWGEEASQHISRPAYRGEWRNHCHAQVLILLCWDVVPARDSSKTTRSNKKVQNDTKIYLKRRTTVFSSKSISARNFVVFISYSMCLPRAPPTFRGSESCHNCSRQARIFKTHTHTHNNNNKTHEMIMANIANENLTCLRW